MRAAVDQYFAALAAHDATLLPLAPAVKYTETGTRVEIGEGLWKTAGAVKFKRSALDVETCNAVTEAVVPDGQVDIVYGLRLKVSERKITEIETIPVHEGDFITPSSTAELMATANDDWETVLPPSERPSRAQLKLIVDKYFKLFPAGVCNFDPSCVRYENGASIWACDLFTSCSDEDLDSVEPTIIPRLHVLDVEAGIAVGVVIFNFLVPPSIDMHMFKVRAGKVVGVHATLAGAEASGWE